MTLFPFSTFIFSNFLLFFSFDFSVRFYLFYFHIPNIPISILISDETLATEAERILVACGQRKTSSSKSYRIA